MKNKPYVVHVCRNNACERAFLDIDQFNAQDTPPRWRYCPDCSAQGMKPVKDARKVKGIQKAIEARKTAYEALKTIPNRA